MEAREMYEFQHHQQQQQQQPIHIATHPHLRHIGHSPSSIICIQSSHPNQNSNSASLQNPAVQNTASSHHHPPTSQQVQSSNDQHMIEQIKKDQQQQPQLQNHLVQNSSHYTHHQQNGESRPSVIESNQPMIIECT
jgi:hypothetical protein